MNVTHVDLLENSMLRPPPQFWDRIKLYMMPSKHQPDFSYLRHVPLRKVHLFTLVQITCLAVLWILKSTFLAIIFPVMVSERTCCSGGFEPFGQREFTLCDHLISFKLMML